MKRFLAQASFHFRDRYSTIKLHIYFENTENRHLQYFLFHHEKKHFLTHFFLSFTCALFATFKFIDTVKYFKRGSTYLNERYAQDKFEFLSESEISCDTVSISEMK
jgi:hypothetical protein